MIKNNLKIILRGIFLFFLCVSSCFAEEAKPKTFAGLEFLTGVGVASLRERGVYRISPMFIDFDYNLKPHLKIIHANKYPGLIQFVLEPFLAYAFSPRDNVEVGNNFLIKIGFLPETWKFQLYFKGGVGFLYMSQHTVEQSTQFNFNEYGGVGMHYFFMEHIAFTVEYRFRHVSNAGIDHPNTGINTHLGLCGISYKF
ncbi:MAG: acyloxyacyl hydrolase [Candidatus Omnitrophota bacterium]